MLLNTIVDDRSYPIEVPQDLLDNAGDFFARIDADMDRGWRMSREFVENPSVRQRCQIAAEKLLNALHTQNQPLLFMMAGYILTRLPGVVTVEIDTTGEAGNTRLLDANGQAL